MVLRAMLKIKKQGAVKTFLCKLSAGVKGAATDYNQIHF